MRPSDALLAAGFSTAWRLARLAPEGPAYAAADAVADRVTHADGRSVRTLRRNLARAVPPDRLEATVRAGVRSYVRYWLDAFRLPSWSAERVTAPVRTEGMGLLHATLGAGRGVVGALAHLGNWDHAGAWAARELAPVTTVAERLRPEGVYRRFVAYRARLGIEVLPLSGGPPPLPLLAERLRGGGFVPLLCDRDLSGHGVTVDLVGEPARVAAGPAALAARTGAALHPVTVHHERNAASPNGWGLVVVVHPEVPVTGRGAVRRAVQGYADAWSTAIRAHPEDWHMLQRVFVADLDPSPAP
ncbi:MAG: phosphatidylinositol mannoside acyltransferase [Kineosporiaceae bacterium]